ncbi:MAG: uracil-DNA glycosylase [Alkaliphilus sp.]|nr:MAG: uracil-DNA glycosylase [Alkaliphilus sp.]
MLLKNDWNQLLTSEFQKDYYRKLKKFLDYEYKNNTVHPDKSDIFNAFNLTAYNDVKVVILGQDPYHGVNQAHGLSFSVKEGIKSPPSLINIFKELKEDLGYSLPTTGCLDKWASEGVLLLNTVLTVREAQANSHKNKGWEIFTDKVISLLNERKKPIVFILWGNNAKCKHKLITNSRHLVIKSAHPSPLSAYRGFWGSKPFSKTNMFLQSLNEAPINWQLK